ncbi:hypothetical protein [Acetobacter conturbans]|uniref:Uncharacterized protein n=1 Tax=Acetobacter conturbans TaxID=1737472 RepID=A0ABX0K1H4_9PROT|nr:hypothetical protein [Acetobacter conturbans]NHN89007.1 hypothetical protein [Acetobacter conturbans]
MAYAIAIRSLDMSRSESFCFPFTHKVEPEYYFGISPEAALHAREGTLNAGANTWPPQLLCEYTEETFKGREEGKSLGLDLSPLS